MDSVTLTGLCSVLANLYPDRQSIRRITDESGIKLTHVILESNAKNNWHSVLVEANKLNQLADLLDVVNEEYRSNKEFRDLYIACRQTIVQTENTRLKTRLLVNTQNFPNESGKLVDSDNVQSRNQASSNVFRNHNQLFRRYTIDALGKSSEYSNFTSQLDSILLLADRIIVAFSEHIEFNRVTKVAETLAAIENGCSEAGRDIDCEILLQSTEQWLKALLWLVDRGKWNTLNQYKKRFTLFPCIRELGLLTQQELDTPEDEYRTICDDVRRLIYWNSKDRNYVTHETSEAPEYIRSRYLPSALLTLIAPVCKHQDTIREKLKGLIASHAFEDPDIAGLIRLIDGERCNHLGRFRARQEWVSRLKKKLLDYSTQSKPYLLLVGHEGMGKSALSAKLSDEFTLQNVDILGPAASEMKKVAPWLPGVILHFGKQSNQPHEIVRSLLSQVNSLLLTPYELAPFLSQPVEEQESEDSLLYHQMILPTQLSRSTRSEIIYPEIRNPTNYLIVQRSASYLGNRDSILQHTATTPDLTRLRRALYLALEQVSREYGSVILIIDAVDEISTDGAKLDFLPEHLPPSISVFLTARRGSQAVSWLMSNRNCEKIQLGYLERNEIPELTGLQDSDGEKEVEFNTRLHKESQGWPVLVQAAIQSIPQHRANLAEIKISRSADSVFERQAREWEQTAHKANDQTLVNLLHLLCIFEPAIPVDLEFVQSYLDYLGSRLRLAELRQILQPVHTQLEGIESGRIKLSIKAFAEYIRERHCSKLDLRQALEKVVEWLSTDQYLPAKLFASFLQYWTNPDHVTDDRIRRTAGELVDVLIGRSDAQLLYEISIQSFFRVKSSKKVSKDLLLPFAQTCLTGAAQLGHLDAMRILGNFMLEGIGFKENQINGEEWLRKAADKGDVRAKKDLGQRLLDGDCVEQNSIEGKRWLYSALEDGDNEVKGILAIRLLDGDGLEKDTVEGEQMLRSLANSGDQEACIVLASRLLEGNGLEKNVEEGEMLLEELVDSGNVKAINCLATHLLNKLDSDFDNMRGIQLLKALADKGDVPAMVKLSNYFLDKDEIPAQQRLEGEMLLKKASVTKDSQAKRIYATRLLHGDGIAQNKYEGEKMLIALANDGSSSSMTVLGEYYFDAGMGKDGQKWLTRAAQEDHVPAMAVLGSRLIMGNGISKNIIRGESWLRKAAEAGHPQAMGMLGWLSLEGSLLKQNLIEGEKWLRSAVDLGEPQAMKVLGIRLLDGDGLTMNQAEGEKWLRNAADLGETQAMCFLGYRLLDGDGVEKNEVEGEKWLRKAVDVGELLAMAIWGNRLLDGDGIEKNEVEGEKWLRKAVDAAEPQAMIFLGLRLIEEDGVTRNVAEGTKWLKMAVEQNKEDYVSLLYALRRANLSFGNQTPPIELLLSGVDYPDPVATMNYALCLASGFGCVKDWEAADATVGSISRVEQSKKSILNWWYRKLTQLRNDPEGHLVVGWLVRHGFIEDPNGLSIQERMQKARTGGWNVPKWMDAEYSM